MQTSNECTNLFKALIGASTELGNVAKTKQGFGYSYAPFDSIVDMLRLVLPKHGIWFSQDVSTNENGEHILETLVFHESGEWMRCAMVMTNTELNGKTNATQQLGASITYFKRYTLSAIFGIATDEDLDGNLDAMQRKNEVKVNSRNARKVEKSDSEKEKDAREYVDSDYKKRVENGENTGDIMKCYSEIIKKEIDALESVSFDDIRAIANELYKRNRRV